MSIHSLDHASLMDALTADEKWMDAAIAAVKSGSTINLGRAVENAIRDYLQDRAEDQVESGGCVIPFTRPPRRPTARPPAHPDDPSPRPAA